MTSQKVILLVEDNIQDEELTVRAFKKNNPTCEIVVARDGEEALKSVFVDNVVPYLVLLDLNLPKIDGLEVLRRLRADERTKLIPVVFFSSSKEERDLASSYALGANSYVRKPIDSKEYDESIASLGFYWSMVNEPPPRKNKKE